MDDELTPGAEDEVVPAAPPALPPSAPAEDDGFDFLTASFDPPEEPVAAVDEVAGDEPPLLAAVPEPEPEPDPAPPVALVPPLAAVPEAHAEPEPEPEPEPVAVAVAEAESEPEPEPEKVPWYKREIGGGKKAAAPASAERAERRPQRRLRPRPEQAALAAADPTGPEPSVPFYKRELSFGKKKAGDEASVPFYKRELGRKKEPAAAQPEPPAAEAAERVPFYKRELSFGRKKGETAAAPGPAEPRRGRRGRRAEPVEAVAVALDEAPTEERKPLYRRELSIRRREKPAAPTAAVADAKAPKEKKAKKEKEPRARREVALPKLERRPKARKAGGGSKRHKKLVGLKIGASQLAAAHVVNNGHAELVKVARESLVDGVVSGGELRDPEALTEALRVFFKKHNLPRRNVRLGIANNRIGVRTFELAGIDDPKQLANAIRFRAQEALPIPIEEAVIDWRVLSEQTDEEGQLTRRILLVVAYRELVDRYVAACRKAGIQLVGIDLEAFALLRALGDGGKRADEDGALVAVSVGHERSTFAVSDGDVCEFTRVLEWGGNSLNVAIARALDKAPSEVEELKRALALDAVAGEDEELPEEFDAEAVAKAREAVRRQLQTFARELVSSLQFYQNQPGSLGIGEIILTGGTAQMPGLAIELERLIGVRVRVGDPLRRIRASKRVAAEGLGSLSVAIGLGIED